MTYPLSPAQLERIGRPMQGRRTTTPDERHTMDLLTAIADTFNHEYQSRAGDEPVHDVLASLAQRIAAHIADPAERAGFIETASMSGLDVQAPHVGHFSHIGGTWWCDTCNSPYCELA